MTVLELVDRILRAMGSTLEPDVRNEASNEIRDQYLDARESTAMLGWPPAVHARRGPARDRRLVHGVFRDVRLRAGAGVLPRIPVVILCGGAGTRLSEQTEVRPKPLVEIGGRPILWHIMKHYSRYGFNEFVLALGYKGDQIKRYFLDYHAVGQRHDDLASGRPRRAAQQRHRAVEGPSRRHRRGDADRRAAAAARAVDRRRHVHADLRRRRGQRAARRAARRSTVRAERW